MLWELDAFDYPSNLVSPLDILVQARDDALDYSNKFGKPMLMGFTRAATENLTAESVASGSSPSCSRAVHAGVCATIFE